MNVDFVLILRNKKVLFNRSSTQEKKKKRNILHNNITKVKESWYNIIEHDKLFLKKER